MAYTDPSTTTSTHIDSESTPTTAPRKRRRTAAEVSRVEAPVLARALTARAVAQREFDERTWKFLTDAKAALEAAAPRLMEGERRALEGAMRCLTFWESQAQVKRERMRAKRLKAEIGRLEAALEAAKKAAGLKRLDHFAHRKHKAPSAR